MKYSAWMAATALAAALALPLSAGAQDKKDQNQPAPQAAPHPAPAPHAAPPPHAAAAPHIAAPPHPVVRAAPPRPAVQAPHPVVRAAPPHPSVHAAPHPVAHAAPSRNVERHATAPNVSPQRGVTARHAEHVTKPAEPRRAGHAVKPAAQAAQSAAPNGAAQATKNAQKTLSPAAQRRADRADRRREQRVLRSLPPKERAAKREEFRHAREQRLNAQANAPVQANANAAAQTKASARESARAQRRNARRNGGTAITAQAARQGRFASRLGSRRRTANAATSADPTASRRAWHHHHRAAFVGWYGPVFWPYAYSDIFDYTFWPAGYEEGYWDYAYDGFFDSLFWGESGPPADYAYADAAPLPQQRVTYAGAQELCHEPGTGVTAWPFSDIARKVGLNAQQKDLLNDMRAAAKKAAAVFKDSCPADDAFALTPTGRLAAMTARLGATLEAVRIVKPALTNFYNSLSDEQKERFNELGPSQTVVAQAGKTGAETTGAVAQDEQSCKQPKPGLANMPIDKIEDVVQPTDAQEDGLDRLQQATDKAVSVLQEACPDETPLTPTGRLDAAEKRLQAMIEAANTVKPALGSFYGSLSNEQKARFNRLGQELAKNND